MRRVHRVLVVSLLALAACGGDDEASDTTAAPDATTGTAAAATEPTTPAATDAPADTAAATDPPTTPAATDAPATTVPATEAPADTAAAGAAVEIGLKEWEVIAPTTMTAGSMTFNVTNTGEFPHQLTIFTGDAYETLPLHPTGAVDIAQAPPLAFTEKIDPGASATLAVDLPAGTYVFVCNIEGGGGSHAARGQHLVVTVA